MNKNTKILAPALLILLFSTFIYSSEASKAIEERVAPVGSVCIEGNDCATSVVSSSIPSAASTNSPLPKIELSEGSEHTVKMLNSGPGGLMVFDPPVIKVSKGDTVHFKAVDLSHNSSAVDGMIPEGAENWSGQINQDISITLSAEGVYIYQCDPHTMMAMIGVIQVGRAINMDKIKEKAKSYNSTFVMNNDRLDNYLSQL